MNVDTEVGGGGGAAGGGGKGGKLGKTKVLAKFFSKMTKIKKIDFFCQK